MLNRVYEKYRGEDFISYNIEIQELVYWNIRIKVDVSQEKPLFVIHNLKPLKSISLLNCETERALDYASQFATALRYYHRQEGYRNLDPIGASLTWIFESRSPQTLDENFWKTLLKDLIDWHKKGYSSL